MSSDVGYVPMDRGFGMSFEAFKRDVENLEVAYPLFKRRVINWTEGDLSTEREALRSQILRIESAIGVFADINAVPDGQEGLLESYKARFTEIAREFHELDRHPEEAREHLLQGRRSMKKCIRNTLLLLTLVVAVVGVVVLLHYKTHYV